MDTIAWAKHTSYSSHVERATNYEEALLQLFYGVRRDGDLIGKDLIREAVENGHAKKLDGGWNMITESGVQLLIDTDAVRG